MPRSWTGGDDFWVRTAWSFYHHWHKADEKQRLNLQASFPGGLIDAYEFHLSGLSSPWLVTYAQAPVFSLVFRWTPSRPTPGRRFVH